METIKELTPEQEALIVVVRDKWLDIALKPSKPDYPRMRKAAKWLYKICGRPEPRVHFARSPEEAQKIARQIDKGEI